MWHKPCRTFHPWCLCIKTRCLSPVWCRVVACSAASHYLNQCWLPGSLLHELTAVLHLGFGNEGPHQPPPSSVSKGQLCQWQGQFILNSIKMYWISSRCPFPRGGAQSLKKGVNHYTCITPSRCNTVTGPGNISEWNCDQNTAIFIEKMPWKMSSAKWQPFYLRPKLSYLP